MEQWSESHTQLSFSIHNACPLNAEIGLHLKTKEKFHHKNSQFKTLNAGKELHHKNSQPKTIHKVLKANTWKLPWETPRRKKSQITQIRSIIFIMCLRLEVSPSFCVTQIRSIIFILCLRLEVSPSFCVTQIRSIIFILCPRSEVSPSFCV